MDLIRGASNFPAAYDVECNLSLPQIRTSLAGVFDLWHWQLMWHTVEGRRGKEPRFDAVEGRIPFRRAGRLMFDTPELVRITGERPAYTAHVGLWPDETERTPSCGEVHATVQQLILPLLGARNVRPSAKLK